MSWNMHKNKGSGALGNSDAGEVLRIYQMLTPKPDELVVSGRRFVKEGDVQVWSVKERMKKNRHLFLFNDVLLITKKEGKKKYWLKVYISLKSELKIQDVQDSSNDKPDVEFRIYAPKKTFILFGFNPSHKQEWIGAIQQQIDQLVGKVENAKKERIDSLYQAPPPQYGSGGGFHDDPFARSSVQASPPPQHVAHYSPEPARASMAPQPAYHLGPLDAPPPDENVPVPMLPPPPGMNKHLSQAPSPVAHDPFAQIPIAGPPQVVNPYAPPNYAQPPYQPQLMQPMQPSPYGAPLLPQVPPHASVYAPGAPAYGSGAALGGGIPALPPKPVPNPNPAAAADPFASLMKPLPTPAPVANAPPPARDPFGDDDFDQLARRSHHPGNSGNPF
eukprot:TRINITY_DN1400_c0_g1_i2.p1 TRINITY_DN1400_c0_g1~~TRINITY_DN1400_c0_g1_i2.p1  ORF type:complete len:388 (-),score=118.95 TRINITY_DN1400_c0_g1_i2:201-1364(-)